MTLPSSPRLIEHPANLRGRDFIVGDLHGMRDALYRALDRVRFDTGRDRLFGVGDQVDRGPDSLGCLELLNEPWFDGTLGNHERMLLAHLGQPESWIHRFHAQRYSRRWVKPLSPADRERLNALLPQVLALPWARKIQNPGKGQGHYYVLHADRWFKGRILTDAELDHALKASSPDPVLKETLTWSRRLAALAIARGQNHRQEHAHEVSVSQTYVGHTVVPSIMQYRSHVFIDRGAGLAALSRSRAAFTLPLIEHRPEGWADR